MRIYLKLISAVIISTNICCFLPVNLEHSIFVIPPAYSQSDNIKVIILDFENNTGNKDWDYMQQGIPRILNANLSQNKNIEVIEKSILEKAFTDLNIKKKAQLTNESINRIGSLTMSDYALSGKITKSGTTIIIDPIISNIHTGETKHIESFKTTDENSVINLLDKFSETIVNNLFNNNQVVNNDFQNIKSEPIVQPIINTEVKPILKPVSLNDKLVFSAKEKDNERHIYIPDNNGNISRISTLKGKNFSPVWSPDGTKIAYINNKYGTIIFDVNSNSTTQLSENSVIDESPKWNYDGKRIVFLTKEKNNYAIYSVDPITHIAIALSPPDTDIKSFDLSKYNIITYSAKINGNWQIFLVDINGNNIQQLTTQGNNILPVWSPDGTKIAFISDRNNDLQKIYTMNSNGTNQTQITKDEYDNEDPIWSPDGTKIAFISLIGKKGKVSVVDSNGGDQKILTNDKGDYYDIKWLPNGEDIGFTYEGSIYMVNANQGLKSMLNMSMSEIEEPDWKK